MSISRVGDVRRVCAAAMSVCLTTPGGTTMSQCALLLDSLAICEQQAKSGLQIDTALSWLHARMYRVVSKGKAPIVLPVQNHLRGLLCR